MDNNDFGQRWPRLKERLPAENPELRSEELIYEIGKEAELMLLLEEKLKKNRKEIDNWLSMMG